MAIDKYKLWLAFVNFKEQLEPFRTKHNTLLIDYIQSTESPEGEDAIETPTAKEVANHIGLAQSKVSKMLRDLYINLIDNLFDKKLDIVKVEQVLLISTHWDEGSRKSREERDESIALNVNFKVIPRIGEEIRLPFIDANLRFNHGYVHEVTHEIFGSVQKITIEAHPSNNYYYKWEKMREEKERRDGWKKRTSVSKPVATPTSRRRSFVKFNSGLS